MRYRTIVADPPWSYRLGDFTVPKGLVTSGERREKAHTTADTYPRMSTAELLAMRVPADDNAHLYLWTVNAFMVEAHEIAQAWGFKPKTILTWVKTHHGDVDRVSMKTGFYFRGATEHVIFAVRGSLPLQTRDAFPTAFLWSRLPHSVKPDAFYDVVEQASPGPYLDMFSRRARLGWDTWGDEALHGTEAMSA